jgi:hypothetical protein
MMKAAQVLAELERLVGDIRVLAARSDELDYDSQADDLRGVARSLENQLRHRRRHHELHPQDEKGRFVSRDRDLCAYCDERATHEGEGERVCATHIHRDASDEYTRIIR